MAHNVEKEIDGVIRTVTEMDHTAQEIDDAVEVTKVHSNPQLLDNWYWGDPDIIIDQRGGWVVPPNVGYYTLDWSTMVGTTATYYPVKRRVQGENLDGIIEIGGVEYVVAHDQLVRGYVGEVYGIDRWLMYGGTLLIQDENILLKAGTHFYQRFQVLDIPKSTLTLSVWRDNDVAHLIFNVDGNNHYTDVVKGLQFGFGYDPVYPGGAIYFVEFYAVEDQLIKAVKLELGTQQTLAHQDENGNWVLNEIPNYAEELAKCQRYFVNLNPGYGSYFTVGSGYVIRETAAEIVAPIPTTMRAFPVVVTNGFAVSAGPAALWVEDASVYNCGSGSVNLHCTISGGPAGHPCFAYGGVENYVWLDANL